MKTLRAITTNTGTTNTGTTNTGRIRHAGRLTAVAGLVGTMLLPATAGAANDQSCTGRSIRFISGQTASSDTLAFGTTLPAGVYDAMLVTADSYPDRASSDAAGQQTEIVEVAGIVSRDLADGVEMTNDITYGRFTASAPFSSVTAHHRASTPGPNSVWVSTFCVTPTAPTPSAPTTAPPTTASPTTAPPTTAPGTTLLPTTVPATVELTTTSVSAAGSSTTAPSTAGPTTTIAVPSVTSTSMGTVLGSSTSVAPPSSTLPVSVVTTVPSEPDSGEPFGVDEPIPAGPLLPDVMQPQGTPQPFEGTLPVTGVGLGSAVVALALIGVGLVTTSAAKD